jgi:hypothetical protein
MSINIELTRLAIQNYFKAKEDYVKLLTISSGKELKDALAEYERTELVLRSHGGVIEICHECDGNKGFYNGHNGDWEKCHKCNGRGESPYGTKEWESKKEEQRLNFLKEAEKITYEKLAEWEKLNPAPKFN